ncbi:MAG: DUF808 domain-containing protein, partial [Paracoccaceae bacterium]
VIDDAAVTPKYVHGFEAKRELPIIGRIAMGSLRNKLLILLPAALALSAFAPWIITPLLMIGGAYLCFEGAEKIAHRLFPHDDAHDEDQAYDDPSHLEEAKVAGAIKTDFILSAEIMTIALSEIPDGGILLQAVTLGIVGTAITVLVYGTVALIVKADDFGVHLARESRFGIVRAFGRGLVAGMPPFMSLLSTIGTAAMLWVGGSILVHGLEVLGYPWLGHTIHDLAATAAHMVPQAEAVVEWLVTAFIDLLIGIAVGIALVPVASRVIAPVLRLFSRKPAKGH